MSQSGLKRQRILYGFPLTLPGSLPHDEVRSPMSSYKLWSSSSTGIGSCLLGPFPVLLSDYNTLIHTQPTTGCTCSRSPPTYHQSTQRGIMIASTIERTSYNERQIRLIEYLKGQVKAGKNFFKSKYIARETGLSSKEVGTNMGLLAETCPEFIIQKYSYSNSTTWLVTPCRG